MAGRSRWSSGRSRSAPAPIPSNIVDSCYPYGSIQVPSGTEPIVLHRDAVSGGGYFMLGTVISADMDFIGQMQPHAEARFVSVDMRGRARRVMITRRVLQACGALCPVTGVGTRLGCRSS